ncbi:hypothetical protein Goshw_014327, partial [Gossypium schwendimanii]|nr:hypothetical protein [Gossypium schwendimanii]
SLSSSREGGLAHELVSVKIAQPTTHGLRLVGCRSGEVPKGSDLIASPGRVPLKFQSDQDSALHHLANRVHANKPYAILGQHRLVRVSYVGLGLIWKMHKELPKRSRPSRVRIEKHILLLVLLTSVPSITLMPL